jgi:iron complex outermembrane receptor protein
MLSVPALALLLPATTLAQDDNAPLAIEEVIVTATRREEKLQEVPMSVSAFTGAFLEDAGLTDFSKIGEYTPSLKISPGTDSRATSIRIRGIGSVGTNSGIDPSVGFFIDGVYQGRAGMSISDLIDIERVEVLRGPQGTLYGKNTAAGAISVITVQPDTEFGGQAELTYTSQDRLELRGVVNIPLGDSPHATRLAAFKVDGDHLWDNTYADGAQDKFNDANKWGLRSRTRFDTVNAGEFLLTLDYTKEETDCCVFTVMDYTGLSTLNIPNTNNPSEQWAQDYAPRFVYSAFEDTEPQGSPPPADPFGDDRWVSADIYNQIDVGGVGLEWNYDLDSGHGLTFINAWRHYESDSGYDGDFTAYDAVVGTTVVELDQYSSELRIASPGGETIDYQGGLYAYYSELDSTGTFTMLPPILSKLGLAPLYPNGSINTDTNEFTTTSFAAFGQGTWNISDQWSATLGARWTYEQKDRVSSQVSGGFITGNECDYLVDLPPIVGPCLELDETRNDSDISPTLILRYFPSEDLMTYASISRGFKSGGFDQRRVPEGENGEFDEEIATSYELGWKGTFYDRRLQMNGTFYYVEYDDFQSQTFDGSSIKVTNAGSMESYGMELELMFVATEHIDLGSGIGYNKAEYQEFDNAQCTVLYSHEVYWEDPNNNQAPGYANPPCTADLAGKPVDNTPEWTVSSFLQFNYPVSDNLNTVTRLEHNYTDEYFLDQDLDPELVNEATHLLNLRFTLSNMERDWEVAVWGRNLLDEESYAYGIDIPLMGGFGGIPIQERTYGVTLRYFSN